MSFWVLRSSRRMGTRGACVWAGWFVIPQVCHRANGFTTRLDFKTSPLPNWPIEAYLGMSPVTGNRTRKFPRNGQNRNLSTHPALYESGYSLHTLRQASRRSWRIGQKWPVRMKFMCQEGTMQTACLRHMGKKLLVALTMEGKFAGEGLQTIDEDGRHALGDGERTGRTEWNRRNSRCGVKGPQCRTSTTVSNQFRRRAIGGCSVGARCFDRQRVQPRFFTRRGN